jgi:hypothetical protein
VSKVLRVVLLPLVLLIGVRCISAPAMAFDEKAEIERVMTMHYGQYDKATDAWHAKYRGDVFTMKVAAHKTIQTPYGDRLYVLAAGDSQSSSCHGCAGLIGLFLSEERDHTMELLSASPEIEMGSWGKASNGEFYFRQFGPDYQYGWNLEYGYTAQGVTIATFSLFLPKDKVWKAVADIPASFDNSNTCATPPCRDLTKLDEKLNIDSSNDAVPMYPLSLDEVGTEHGKAASHHYVISFDEKRWEYVLPPELPERR